MNLTEFLGTIRLADWLALLLPGLLLLAFVYLRIKRRADGAGDPRHITELRSWPDRLRYALNLLVFAIGSFLVLSLSMMVYQNILMAKSYLAPAPSEVSPPAAFSHSLHAVQFKSEGSFRLEGWLIEPELPAVVILLHGYGANRSAMLWHADQLAQAGFGVLLYDERASGMSQGDRRSYGWQDPVDVSAAVDWLEANPATATANIGIGGCSIGAQIALQSAARDSRLQAVWADGPAIVRARDLPPPHNWASVITSISSRITDWTFAAYLGRMPPPPLIKQLPAIEPRPVMFVAGGRSVNLIGPESRLTERLYQHAGPSASFWVIEEAVHCDGPAVKPEAYSNLLVDFFEESLLQ